MSTCTYQMSVEAVVVPHSGWHVNEPESILIKESKLALARLGARGGYAACLVINIPTIKA